MSDFEGIIETGDVIKKSKEQFEQKSSEVKKQEISNLQEVLNDLRKESDTYKTVYSKEIESLNEIAKSAGFKELLVLERFEKITTIDFFEGYCFFPSAGLKNQKSIEEIDKNFADKGTFLIMQHEKQHFENPAKKVADEPIKYSAETTREEKNEKEYEKAIKIENQVNLQTLSKNLELENKKEIINSVITENIYKDFIYKGIGALKQESTADYYSKVYKFLNPEIIEMIVDKENEVKEELLEKYNEMQEEK